MRNESEYIWDQAVNQLRKLIADKNWGCKWPLTINRATLHLKRSKNIVCLDLSLGNGRMMIFHYLRLNMNNVDIANPNWTPGQWAQTTYQRCLDEIKEMDNRL
jgi:hypothetical protein